MFEGFETGHDRRRRRIDPCAPQRQRPAALAAPRQPADARHVEVAPWLAGDFTVVATDLRGYGDSSKPETAPDHAPYSKRAMARDQISVMRSLGFERFFVCGHYLPEEAPEETCVELRTFFGAGEPAQSASL